MEIIALATTQWQTFLLILTRISGMLLVAPVLSNRGVATQVRVAMALAVSAVLFPVYAPRLGMPQASTYQLLGAVAGELAVGLLVGFAFALVFAAFQAAGGIIGLQAGLGLGGVFDPVTGSQTTAVDHLYTILATLLFLALDGHHLLFLALSSTFHSIPPGAAVGIDPARVPLVDWTAQMLLAAVQIALPVLVALILADLLLAVIARAVPQIHVLIVGMPLKLLVLLMAMSAALSTNLSAIQSYLSTATRQLGVLVGGA